MTENITVIASDGTKVVIERKYVSQSELLSALVFDQDEVREIILPLAPSIYLRFAALYLKASSNGYNFEDAMTDEQLALVTVRNVVYYPELLKYLVGYLGILSFQNFYQRMLLAVIDQGTINANIARHLEQRSLDLLPEEQLYAVSEYEPARINLMYRVPNARNYLRLKFQRDTLALSGPAVLEARDGKLWANGRHVPTVGKVQHVYTRTQIIPARSALRIAERYRHQYYYLSEGKVYQGIIHDDGTLATARHVLAEQRLSSMSIGRRWLAGMTEESQVFLADLADPPAFPPGVIDAEEVREVISSRSAERLVLLLSGGRVALYGNNNIQSVLSSLVANAPAGIGNAPRQIPTPWPIRLIAPDESRLVTEKLWALDSQGLSFLTNGAISVDNRGRFAGETESARWALREGAVEPMVMGLGPLSITFNTNLTASRLGKVLEREVVAVAYEPHAQRLVFRATNGALRYWRTLANGEWTREYQRRR
jgi:hypothetical protein